MNHAFRKPPIGLATALVLAIAVVAGIAIGQEEQSAKAPDPIAVDPASLNSELMPRAANSLLLDIAIATSRAVVVGERGHVLVSETRREWRQIENVPTRSTLTGVTAVGDKLWAVGHDGVILHSTDGGLVWQRQRVAPYDSERSDALNGAPLLDVLFLDENNGFAIGAYALMLRTRDGGTTWERQAMVPELAAESAADDEDGDWTFDSAELELEAETDPHLNAIARTGDGSLMIVAERGAAFVSTNGGNEWQRLKMPYEGSMFGVIGYQGRKVLAFGLRGNVYESADLGITWAKVDTGVNLSLFGGTSTPGGGAVLVGANGMVLTRSTNQGSLLAHSHPDESVLAAVAPFGSDGEVIVVGENGVALYKPN